MILLIQYTLIFASVLMLVALGGCISEHSGIINLGLEGIMVMGALGGSLMLKYLSPDTPAFVTILLTVLAAMLVGLIFSALLAVACVNCKADQTIIGTALNLLATAAAVVIVKAVNTAENPDNVSATVQYIGTKKAFIVNLGGFEFNWFMLLAVIALVIVSIMLYRTRFGLRLQACGEHPQAADSVGINVYKMRWAGVLISGVLGGLGGIVYITAGDSEWKFEYGVAGFGFLALAVMIFTHPPFATEAGSAPHLAEAMGTMVIIMIVMNIVVNTFGAALIRSRGSTVKEVLSFMVKMPALYAAILAILVRSAGIHLEHTFLWPVLTHFNGAFIVLVTVTIGLQLHRSKLRKPDRFILATSFNKLILCPAIAWGVLTLFGGAFSPIASQVFFICAAVPSSMALIIYGVEYGEDAGLVTQSVLFSTVAGALTLTCMIYLARVLFPLAG